jgi:hypothetical protein
MFRTVAALLAVAAVPALGFAQPGPYLATVADPEVKLRAGPSDQFPETGTLPRGAVLIVEREEPNGWLAVHAPQGQVSWVHHTFLDGADEKRQTPYRVVVASDSPVTLAAGSAGVPQPLQVRRVQVPNGTILTVTGPPVRFDGKGWYPVAPPPGDYRYVPKSAVQFEKPANTAFVVRDAAPLPPSTAGLTAGARPEMVSPPGVIQPVSSPPPAPKPAVNHPLWAQAEAAEQAGKYDEAEKLFFELARVMNGPGGDHDIANLCYTRIHGLREKKRGSAVAIGPGAPNASPPKDARSTLLPPSASGVTPISGGPTAPGSVPPPTGADDKPRWSGAGVLTRSALALDGRQTYALESSPGVVRLYVVPAPGLDLEEYVNRRVDVYGINATRRDLSRPFVVASSIEVMSP